MTSGTSNQDSAGSALQTWREKLDFLLEQEATAVDADHKFALRKQIQKARARIRQLERSGSQAPPCSPRLHNLPYPPLGDLFTGRQVDLDALAGGETAAITQSAAISGLGGIGKTRLAVEYAWRSGPRYTAAWFARADSPENLRRNLAALAGPTLLNLPERKAQEEEETVGAVLRWLREHPGWLMILDNVDTPEAAAAVLEVLPSLLEGRVLITSRLTTWPASVRKRSLDTLSREEAVRFLLHRTEGGREPAANDAERAADLAQRVDGLPLALEQAAAYIVRHRLRFTDYLGTWEEARQEVLRWFDERVMQYPASVAVTWQQTFQQLGPMAASLLRLMAFLAPDPIPVDLLDQSAEHVEKAMALLCEETGNASEEKTTREAIADLAEYSMISRQDGGTITVHRMVQEAVRNQVPEDHRKVWIEGALQVVNAAAVENPHDVRTWPVWNRLRPHAAEIVVIADQAGISDPTSRLMDGLGWHLERLTKPSLGYPIARYAPTSRRQAMEPARSAVTAREAKAQRGTSSRARSRSLDRHPLRTP